MLELFDTNCRKIYLLIECAQTRRGAMSDIIRRIQNRPKANPEVVFAKELAHMRRIKEVRTMRNRVLFMGTALGVGMALVVLAPLYFLGVISSN